MLGIADDQRVVRRDKEEVHGKISSEGGRQPPTVHLSCR